MGKENVYSVTVRIEEATETGQKDHVIKSDRLGRGAVCLHITAAMEG